MEVSISPTIRRHFDDEFSPVADKFETFDLQKPDWRNHELLAAARPGVYVWFDAARDKVMKVGLSLVNARARALQHLRDDTGGKMAAMAENPDARLVLYTLAEEDKHWAAALEIYFERELDPLVRSLR